jgi:hypothetical protein
MDQRNLRSVRQLGDETPISEDSWRWLLFNRKENGLDVAVVRIGRRLYLDIERVREWLEARRLPARTPKRRNPRIGEEVPAAATAAKAP